VSLTFVEKTDLNVLRALGEDNETARIHCSSMQRRGNLATRRWRALDRLRRIRVLIGQAESDREAPS
jgi:hypothetical protein